MIAKELRALLPAWAAAASALIACGLTRDLYPLAIPAYFIGAASLGAMSVGHEFAHRTMPLMLTLPVTRRRIVLTKLVVLGALLLLLASVAVVVLPAWREAHWFRDSVLWLPFFAALFITPYLTTITRSPVGGAVFTIGIAGMLLIASEWIGVTKYGYSREVDGFRAAFVWRAEILLCAASAILMWRTFMRLEALEGAGPAVDLAPRASVTSTALSRRNATWLLVEKELRLQQLAFAVAAIYVVLYIAVVARARGLAVQSEAAFIVTMLFAGIAAVVIGSVASAEERHLRTIDAQLLLPMRTSRQWLIKVAVVLGLTVLLGVLLPAVMATVLPPEQFAWRRNFYPTITAGRVLGLMSIATVSLYISTLCASGLWALLLSVPAAFGTMLFVLKLDSLTDRFFYSLPGRPNLPAVAWASGLMTMAVAALVLRLALDNHRSADRGRARIARQVAVAVASAAGAAAVVAVVGVLSR